MTFNLEIAHWPHTVIIWGILCLIKFINGLTFVSSSKNGHGHGHGQWLTSWIASIHLILPSQQKIFLLSISCVI